MIVTFSIAVINVIVFLFQKNLPENFSFLPAALIKNPYSLITSIFMHSGVYHLLINMFGLLMFGLLLEREIGGKKWLFVYIISGVIGNLGYLVFGENPFVPAVGASGAIFGLIGALAVIKPKLVIYTPYGPLPMAAAAIMWGITEFISSLNIDNIAQSAHIFGLLGGALISFLYVKKFYKVVYPFGILIIFLTLLFSLNLESEIRGYKPNCEIIEKIEKINFKFYYLKCENNFFISKTSPKIGEINPAFYNNYFPLILKEIYGCEPNYSINLINKTVILNGSVCDYKFIARAKDCGYERFELIEIYKDKSISRFSCNILS